MHDPLANPEPLIRRVYSYVAYRIGDGPEAEDVTGDAFERALRHRGSYNRRKGEPIAWLLGIARRCIEDHRAGSRPTGEDPGERAAPGNLEEEAVRRLTLHAAVAGLSNRDRELIALRYGADLSARQIADLLGVKTNAAEVALHRALERLRRGLEGEEAGGGSESVLPALPERL